MTLPAGQIHRGRGHEQHWLRFQGFGTTSDPVLAEPFSHLTPASDVSGYRRVAHHGSCKSTDESKLALLLLSSQSVRNSVWALLSSAEMAASHLPELASTYCSSHFLRAADAHTAESMKGCDRWWSPSCPEKQCKPSRWQRLPGQAVRHRSPLSRK